MKNKEIATIIKTFFKNIFKFIKFIL